MRLPSLFLGMDPGNFYAVQRFWGSTSQHRRRLHGRDRRHWAWQS